jgi:uncharacterized Zn-binding protein involved in type VI secretion
MGNVVRIGDRVDCGDVSAQGSSNVFANGMPIVHQGKKTTTGHGCFPPTVFIGPWTSTVFVNSNAVAIKGKTKIQPHRCGRSEHDGKVVSGAATVSFEG